MNENPAPLGGPIETTGAFVRWEETIDEVPGITGFIARASRLGLGVAGLALTTTANAIDRLGPGESPGGSTLRRLPSAALGIGLAAQERILAISAQVESSAGFAVSAARSLPLVGNVVAAGDRTVERWSIRGEEEQAGNEALLSAFIARLAPEIAIAMMERLDINAIIEALPLDSVLERVDVDALIGRVNVDNILERVDVDALMTRLDIGPVAQKVLDTVDIGAIVRESTGSVTGDVVDVARVQTMQLDSIVERIVDTLLLRNRRGSARGRAHLAPDVSSNEAAEDEADTKMTEPPLDADVDPQ